LPEMKICDYCGGIIGSSTYKTFHSKKDHDKKFHYHVYCSNLMKYRGLTSMRCTKCNTLMERVKETLIFKCPKCDVQIPLIIGG